MGGDHLWEAIGALGDILGAAAVFVSLIYLAMQIRTQNKEARISALQGLLASMRDTLKLFIEPGVAEEYLLVLSGSAEATPAQKLRVTMVLMEIWKLSEGAYFEVLEGRLDEITWNSFNSQLADVMANPVAVEIWQSRSHQFDKRFRQFMQELAPGEQLYGIEPNPKKASDDA